MVAARGIGRLNALQRSCITPSLGDSKMKPLAWIVLGVGVVAAYVLINQPGPMSATGDDDVEEAAGRTTLWGSKQRITGTGARLAGRVKKGVGTAIGDDELSSEGVVEQVVGATKSTAGKVAQAAGQTLHDLNQ
jgi:uncharacterized protein YjbJ (UPF0337 family)